MIIYFDMDGVLCNFYNKIIEHYGVPFSSDMWPSIAATYPRIYRDLEPFQDMVDYVNGLSRHIEVKILSAQPSLVHMEFCVQDKIEWCKKYMNKDIEVIIESKAQLKQYHATSRGILVDDSIMNINQWISRGGIGVHHTFHDKTVWHIERIINEEGQNYYV